MIMQVIQRFVLSLSYQLNVVQNIGTNANKVPKYITVDTHNMNNNSYLLWVVCSYIQN